MKFEMEIGYIQNEKITVETWDFDKIEIIKDFIAFQEDHGWAVEYEAVELDDEDLKSMSLEEANTRLQKAHLEY